MCHAIDLDLELDLDSACVHLEHSSMPQCPTRGYATAKFNVYTATTLGVCRLHSRSRCVVICHDLDILSATFPTAL